MSLNDLRDRILMANLSSREIKVLLYLYKWTGNYNVHSKEIKSHQILNNIRPSISRGRLVNIIRKLKKLDFLHTSRHGKKGNTYYFPYPMKYRKPVGIKYYKIREQYGKIFGRARAEARIVRLQKMRDL